MDAREVFAEQARQWGISDAERLLANLCPFVELLGSYDKANVVGTRNPAALLLDHVLDSLSCLLYDPLLEASSIVDVGAGAGLPGIPLKIASPKLRTTLIESTGKKARFLQFATKQLGLSDVFVINRRVEEVALQPDQRSCHDIAVSRAVSSLPVLAEYCVPLVREQGSVVTMKGEISRDELQKGMRAATQLGARLIEIKRVPLHPHVRARKRNLLILRKVGPTPEKYPRRAGIATKRPLGGE